MPWNNIVDGKLRLKAYTIALNVAKAISDKTLNRGKYAADIIHPSSLVEGHAGFAMLCNYCHVCQPNHNWKDIAHQHIRVALDALNNQANIDLGLFNGITGICLAMDYLAKTELRYNETLMALDRIIIPRINKKISKLKESKKGLYTGEYDLVSGISGIGAYALMRHKDPEYRQTIEDLLQCILYLVGMDGNIPRWYTPPEKMKGTLAACFKNGFLDCGLAHGIPGLLSVMSLAQINGTTVPGQLEAIDKVATWLLNNATPDKWGINWPAAVPLDKYQENTVKDTEKFFSQDKPTKMAWCYGAAGILRALWLAASALESTTLKDRVIRDLIAALSKPEKKYYLSSPTFCHGYSGLLHIANVFYNDTGNQFLKQKSNDLIIKILSNFNAKSEFGFQNISYDNQKEDLPGILEGASGICLTLLAATTNISPHWNRIFLCS